MNSCIRRFAAICALGALLFAQLAVSAFACPGEVGMTMHSSAQAEAMQDCHGMDGSPSPLCPAHCAQGQQSLDKPQAPGVSPATLIGTISWRAMDPPRIWFDATRYHARLVPPPEPPPAIRNCCLRI
jgi:hypothetical protein